MGYYQPMIRGDLAAALLPLIVLTASLTLGCTEDPGEGADEASTEETAGEETQGGETEDGETGEETLVGARCSPATGSPTSPEAFISHLRARYLDEAR